MSNVKTVSVRGMMPFNVTESEAARSWLGTLNAPTIGIRIQYGPKEEYVPNEHGGRTAMVQFSIHGSEAMSFGALVDMMAAFAAAGTRVDRATAVDEESGLFEELDLLSEARKAHGG